MTEPDREEAAGPVSTSTSRAFPLRLGPYCLCFAAIRHASSR